MPTSAVHGNLTSTLRKIGTLPASAAVFYAALNIFLSITAFLGNALILTALCKVSSVRPPTKLLFKCLAITDLLVGLITQPFSVALRLNAAPKVHSQALRSLNSTSLVLCRRSIDLHIDRHKCGHTSRPVTGTAIQRLCYFKASSRSYHLFLVNRCLSSSSIRPFGLSYWHGYSISFRISLCCYLNIFLHEDLPQTEKSPSSSQ